MKVRGTNFNRREFCLLSGTVAASVVLEASCNGVSGFGFPNFFFFVSSLCAFV
jgi:hypothetical protein